MFYMTLSDLVIWEIEKMICYVTKLLRNVKAINYLKNYCLKKTLEKPLNLARTYETARSETRTMAAGQQTPDYYHDKHTFYSFFTQQ